ncbi:MAG TPA: YhjD/YihY/BrkB family envelope integrity protein, partial [Candidatus Hydrogenedentes bacterium]|nr:YhjD/YihY/BrkB family envelope integrity protein [Candidatus Hydrogenedentota bacterium]
MNQYVKRVFDAFERGRRFVTRDMWQLGRPGERLPRGFVIKHARVAVLVVTGFVKDDLLMRASALTLASLLSLVPILAVMFWIINAFSLENDVYGYLYSITEKAFSVVTQTPSPGSDAAAGGATSEPGPFAGETPRRAADFPLRDVLVGLFFRKIPPQAGGDAYLDPVDFLVNYAADQAKHSGTIGVSGLALVLVAIFGLMSNIEFAFNRIWGLSNRRSWYRMISDYTMVTLLLPVVCTALLGVTAVLLSQSMHAELGRFAALM